MLVIPPPTKAQLPRNPDHTIVRALWTSALLMAFCTLVLSGAVLFHFFHLHHRSRENVHQIEYYRTVLDAATSLAAERGPANSAMGEAGTGLADKIARLLEARRKTDKGLEALRTPAERKRGQAVPPKMTEHLLHQLARARASVDMVISKPLEERRYEDIQAAIEGMVAASDLMDNCLRWLSGNLIAEDEDLANPVVGGQILIELRDYTGRIASHIIAPLIVRQPMPLKNQMESRLTRGRVMELLRLLDLSVAAYPEETQIPRKKLLFEQHFLQEGLRMVDRALEEGDGRADYSQTAAELSSDYVPTIKPVEEVRNLFLDAAIADLYSKERHARLMLIAVSTGTLIVVLFLIGIAAAVQVFLFGPLLNASAMVIDLADGRPVHPPAKPWRGEEMRRLYDALNVLGERMREWAALVSRLKTEADTDGMTGLLNRAAFERLVHRTGALDGCCLILIDIDHFKSINDRFGHPAGDNVIRHIAELLHAELGSDHVAARFGGEEFAILYRSDAKRAVLLCERLRRAIGTMPVPYDNLMLPTITASFGLASHGGDSFEDLVRRADAALYRAKGEGRNRVCIGL